MENEIAERVTPEAVPHRRLRVWARKEALRLALLLYPAALGSEVDVHFLRQERGPRD